jgi:hypothetical protein
VEFFGLVVLYFLGIFFVGGFAVLVLADRRDVGLVQAWRGYARRHRYAFAGRQTPDRAFRIRGTRDGVEFRLETDTRHGILTRLVARNAAAPLDGRVVAALGRGRASDDDGPRTPTGDAHFDRVFDVRGTAASDVDMVLRETVRRALQRFPMPMVGGALRLVVDGDEILVEWAGGEVDPARLDAGHAILLAVCGTRDRRQRDGERAEDATTAVPPPMGR